MDRWAKNYQIFTKSVTSNFQDRLAAQTPRLPNMIGCM
jgi:hypothetical protein